MDEDTLEVLSALGEEEHNEVQVKYRGKIPDSLTDVLIQQLRPGVRVKIARKLIELATEGRGSLALNAIKEINDRVEGKARQSMAVKHETESIVINVLKDVYKEDRRLISEGTYTEIDDPD